MGDPIVVMFRGGITQEHFDRMCEREIRYMMDAQMPMEDVQTYELEWKGGDCIFCGKPYRMRKVHREVEEREDDGKKSGRKILLADYTDFEPMCQCTKRKELQTAESKRVAASLLRAGVPSRFRYSSFDSWDLEGAGPDLSRAMAQCKHWAITGQWKSAGLFLHGPPGTGKTHCAVAALREITWAEPIETLFIPAAELVELLLSGTGESVKSKISYASIVLIDDVDKLRSLDNQWVSEQVFTLLDSVTRDERTLIFTANVGGKAEVYGMFPEAFASRIVGNCAFVPFEGKDYRLRNAPRIDGV